MQKFTIVTIRQNWQKAVACLEPIPRHVDVFCRERGVHDLSDSNTIKIQYDASFTPEMIEVFIQQLKLQWADTVAEPYGKAMI